MRALLPILNFLGSIFRKDRYYTVNLCRPFARRRFKVSLPPFVLMRLRNPCLRLRFRFFSFVNIESFYKCLVNIAVVNEEVNYMLKMSQFSRGKPGNLGQMEQGRVKPYLLTPLIHDIVSHSNTIGNKNKDVLATYAFRQKSVLSVVRIKTNTLFRNRYRCKKCRRPLAFYQGHG